MTKIEEALAMKNDERRGDEEDEYGSSKVWVGVRLRPSCLACRGWKPGSLTSIGAWSCCSLSIRWEKSDTRSFPSW